MLLKQALNALIHAKYPKISAATISTVSLIETASHTEHWAKYKVHIAKSPHHLGIDSQAEQQAQPHNHGNTNPTFMKFRPQHYLRSSVLLI